VETWRARAGDTRAIAFLSDMHADASVKPEEVQAQTVSCTLADKGLAVHPRIWEEAIPLRDYRSNPANISGRETTTMLRRPASSKVDVVLPWHRQRPCAGQSRRTQMLPEIRRDSAGLRADRHRQTQCRPRKRPDPTAAA
jgi:hypothetical protein